MSSFRPWSERSVRVKPLVRHHAADRFAGVHEVEALVDFVERQGVGDEIVDVDLALHVPVDDSRHLGPALGAAEGGAAPDAPGDELEGARRNLLAGAGNADDGGHAAADVAHLVEGCVLATPGHRNLGLARLRKTFMIMTSPSARSIG